MHTKNEYMLTGSIPKSIIKFAVPLFFGNLFQQLYNTADSLIVGNKLGDTALAAVSSTGMLIFLLVGFFQGVHLIHFISTPCIKCVVMDEVFLISAPWILYNGV